MKRKIDEQRPPSPEFDTAVYKERAMKRNPHILSEHIGELLSDNNIFEILKKRT